MLSKLSQKHLGVTAIPQGEQAEFVINASRIGSAHGLRTFTTAALTCLATTYQHLTVILPQGNPVPPSFRGVVLPNWLGNASRASKLRAVLWMAYSIFSFPVSRKERILSTTHHTVPFCKRQIVTVHDLRPYFEPDTWVQTIYFRFLLPRALRHCDAILTVSATSKETLVSVYKIPAERIYIVPNAISVHPPPHPLPSILEIGAKPYLLMVGATFKHKNAEELLINHELWKPRYQLKILAGEYRHRDELEALVSKLGIKNYVEFLAPVTDIQLSTLYLSSSALIYPSLMEGFGIPPLEAMALGRPVIVSDIPVFRELYGEIPFYIRLGDRESWRTAFAALLGLDADKSDRLRAGVELAKSYSLERMRKALLDALDQVWNLRCYSMNTK